MKTESCIEAVTAFKKSHAKVTELLDSLSAEIESLQDSSSEVIERIDEDRSLYCDSHPPQWDTLPAPLDQSCPGCRMDKVANLVGNMNWCLRHGRILEACYYGMALDIAFETMFTNSDDPEALELGRDDFENLFADRDSDDPTDIEDKAYRAFLDIVEATAKDLL